MGSTTGRPDDIPADKMYPHARHPGVEISGDLLEAPQIKKSRDHIEKIWGPVKRVVQVHTLPGGAMHEHVHPWDSVIYYPLITYDGHEGYVFVSKHEKHEVPRNETDKTRISVVYQLA